MPNTSDRKAAFRFAGRPRRILPLTMPVIAMVLTAGCTEFSHFGGVYDREASGSINGVIIEQQRAGGNWVRIGETDGKGAWNIFKYKITGGYPVRLRKPGYKTIVMNENEFLQQNQILMSPSLEGKPGNAYTDPF